MQPVRVLLFLVVISFTAGCNRSGSDRSISRGQRRRDCGLAGHRPTPTTAPSSRWQSALDRVNQRLEAWVRSADRASVASSTFSVSQPVGFGPDLWKAIQGCHCLTSPGWYQYFLGVAGLADTVSALNGRRISSESADRLVKVYNETALAYNAARITPAFLRRKQKVVLTGLDPDSFNHWLSKLRSELTSEMRRGFKAVDAVRGSWRAHRWALSIRAMWISVQTEQTLDQISRMSCRSTRPCRGLESRRDLHVRFLEPVVENCRAAARSGMLRGDLASALPNCMAAWKRFEAQVARKD